jgi:uncharacterized protein (DUF1800 family)
METPIEASEAAAEDPLAHAIAPGTAPPSLMPAATALLAGAALAACGGGGSDGSIAVAPGPTPVPTPSPTPSPNPGPTPAPTPSPTPAPTPAPAPGAISAQQAARFLAQAAFGGTEADIAHLQAVGYSAWIDEQFAAPAAQGHWDWMVANGYATTTYINSFGGVDATLWRKLMSSPDPLRQRMTLALSEMFVISMAGLPVPWRGMAVAAYVDMLEANAFANFRTLLDNVTLSCGMGVYLNMRGNQKEDPATGRQPDENYAREVMQLFTIGLYQLNADGTPRLSGTAPVETYDQSTVTGMAKVLTGWDFDSPVAGTPDHMRRPMAFIASRHSTSSKTFLGVTLPAGSSDGPAELKVALDTLFNHPNGGPFIGRQLIQRLVTSNPSPAYVARVAAAYANNGAGVRGDLKAVLKAILLDDEARNPAAAAGGGRLREPIWRQIQWARSFAAKSPNGLWNIGDTSDPSTRLGQSPLRSPTVFNFFRPGYVPPNSPIGDQGLAAPEFQIANESTLVAYVNWMQTLIQNGRGDVTADYSALIAGATDAAALFDRLNTVLAAGQLGAASRATIVNAVGTISAATDAGKLRRVQATALLVMTAPEYLVLK